MMTMKISSSLCPLHEDRMQIISEATELPIKQNHLTAFKTRHVYLKCPFWIISSFLPTYSTPACITLYIQISIINSYSSVITTVFKSVSKCSI